MKFEMRADIAVGHSARPSHINWGLRDGQIDHPDGQRPIEIT